MVLCQNNLQDQLTVNLTMAHELVHAYDECRGKVNWSNCLHYACSEVRAAALSGDCDWRNEFLRGNRTIAKQHQVLPVIYLFSFNCVLHRLVFGVGLR